jgi:hypothetical protein
MKTNKRKYKITKRIYTIRKREKKKKQIGGRYIPPRVVPLPPTPETDVILDRYNRLVILYNTLIGEYDDLADENHDLENKNKVLIAEKPEYVSAFNQVKARYNKLIELYDTCLKEHKKIIVHLDTEVGVGEELRKFNIKLKKDNAALKAMLPSSD